MNQTHNKNLTNNFFRCVPFTFNHAKFKGVISFSQKYANIEILISYNIIIILKEFDQKDKILNFSFESIHPDS